MRLTDIEIKNFRGIHYAHICFPVNSRIVCLIGAGDSCKTTILKAIEWVLWPSWSLIATDTDFYNCCTDDPIEITASIAEIPEALMKEDKYGLYLRDWANTLLGLGDEPTDKGTIILTIRLTIDESLEPKWEVITDRTDPKLISHRDRALLSFGVVGDDFEKDFQWGRSSVLQKYSDSKDTLHSAFTQAMRSAVENTDLGSLDEVGQRISEIGGEYGVPFNGDIHNRLIMQNGSYSTTVGVFDSKVPFIQRGLGSKRLLSIGMNVNAYKDGTLVLIDEVETGLEPYRISALINQLRNQFKESGQLIMTTHSRSAVCECTVEELSTVTETNGGVKIQSFNSIEDKDLNADVQRLVRRLPDSFLCKRVIVCEGKTEVGFLRALDNYLFETKGTRLAHFGVGVVFGDGGNNFFKLAKLMKTCGYDTSLLMDSDISEEESAKEEMSKMGISVFSWSQGNSIEEQIFEDVSLDCVEELIDAAINNKGKDSVLSGFKKYFPDESQQVWYEEDGRIRVYEGISKEDRHKIGSIAKDNKKYGEWFKNITKGEHVGKRVLQELDTLDENCGLKTTIDELSEWVTGDEG